jgi:uncharacterized protein YlzI (FlbEa/FlbD family)
MIAITVTCLSHTLDPSLANIRHKRNWRQYDINCEHIEFVFASNVKKDICLIQLSSGLQLTCLESQSEVREKIKKANWQFTTKAI